MKDQFVSGTLDSVVHGHVTGWAFDSRDPYRRVRIDFFIDGKYTDTVTAMLYRTDLYKVGAGDGFHSYRYPLPPACLDGFSHVLQAVVSGTRQHLKHSPMDGVSWGPAAKWRLPQVDSRFKIEPNPPIGRTVPRPPRKKKRSAFSPSGRSLAPESLTGISVVIPTFNRGAHLEETLLQSFECTAGAAVEFIVVDDGSSDDTPERLARLASQHPTLRYLSIANGGQGNARNLGVGLANHEIILFQGDDIRPAHSEFYRLHLEAHRRLPNLGVAILGKVTWPDSPAFPVSFAMRHIQGKGQQQFGYYNLLPYTWLDWRFFYTSNVSLKKQAVANWRKDGFNPQFREYGWEDAELAYRLSRSAPGGFGTLYCPGPVATHHHVYSVRHFMERQVSTGRAAQVFCRMHPNLRRKIGLDELEKILTSPIAPRDFHTPQLDLLTAIEGLKAWPCLLEERGTIGQEAWHDDLLDGVFQISYLQGYIQANRDPWANYDAAWRFVTEKFQSAMGRAAQFEVFGRTPPFRAIVSKRKEAKADAG